MGDIEIKWLHGGEWLGGLYTAFKVYLSAIASNSSFADVVRRAGVLVGGGGSRYRIWACLGESTSGYYQEILTDRDVEWFFKLVSTNVLKTYSFVVEADGKMSGLYNRDTNITCEDSVGVQHNLFHSSGSPERISSHHNGPSVDDEGMGVSEVFQSPRAQQFRGADRFTASTHAITLFAENGEEVGCDQSIEENASTLHMAMSLYTSSCCEHDSSINYGSHPSSTYLQNILEEDSLGSLVITRLGYLNEHVNVSIKSGDIFLNKLELKKCLHFLSIKNSFQFKISRSCSRKLEAICMNQPCTWKICGNRLAGSEIWIIRRMENEHSCSMHLIMREHRQANPFIIAEYVGGCFSVSGVCGMKPVDIMRHMRFNYGVHVSYLNAWRARELAFAKIHGSASQCYALIPCFKFIVTKMNPGSVVESVVDGDHRFRYLFMALHASIQGWRMCRPVLSVDGTFLKNKFGGTLLVASTLDGNNQILPIAFAIVDSENDESWCWFFEMLKSTLKLLVDLSIISDRHKSILKGVSNVIPHAYHGICMYHLATNLMSKFKKKSLLQLFTRCAKSYSVSECQRFLLMIDGICPGVKKYLLDIGLERWLRAHVRGMRYNIMTTNTFESFNARIKDARASPVLALLMEIRNILQQWFYERSCAAKAMGNVLTTWADNQLLDEIYRGNHHVVRCVNLGRYEMIEGCSSHVVDTRKKTCACQKWQVEQIPCSHACASLKFMNMSANKYTSHYYTKETLTQTYENGVFPIGNPNEWEIPVDIKGIVVKPPNVKRPAGRPKSRRFLNQNERRQRVKCGRCGGRGHNRKTCRNALLNTQ